MTAQTFDGLDGSTPEAELPTCPHCGPGVTLNGQYYRHDEGEGYDLFDCPECGHEFDLAALDASSSYRQAVIEGDPVAVRLRALVRLVERRRHEQARLRRRDLLRALRNCRRRMDAFDPGWQ